jgi:hypothetical protein
MIAAILLSSNFKTPLDPLTSIIIMGIFGAAALIGGAIMRDRRVRLLKTGIKIEGTVFRIDYEPRSQSNNSSGQYYPIIRYVTTEGEWITQKHNLGSNPSAFTEGESVTVFYDPKSPSTFILNDKLSKIAPWAVIIIGVVILAVAIIRYFSM